ncbi:MAG TPA: DUF4831 family protein [Thermoanaerobaculia bacterium]|nr:DUF4831 family protein [Thermoanaerobaculia bacterium]
MACASSHRVERIRGNDHDEVPPGIVYSLPRVIVEVEVPVARAITIPGRFARLAPELLGVKAPTSKESSFQLGKPTIAPFVEADPDQVFLVALKGRNPFESRQLAMELSELGIFTKGNSTSENKTIDFAVSTVSSLAGVAAKSIALDSLVVPRNATGDPIFPRFGGGEELESLTGTPAQKLNDLAELAGIDKETKPADSTRRELWLGAILRQAERPDTASSSLLIALDAMRRIAGSKRDLDAILDALTDKLGPDEVKDVRQSLRKSPIADSGEATDRWLVLAADLRKVHTLIGLLEGEAEAKRLRAEANKSFDPASIILLFKEVEPLLIAAELGEACINSRCPSAALVVALGMQAAIDLVKEVDKAKTYTRCRLEKCVGSQCAPEPCPSSSEADGVNGVRVVDSATTKKVFERLERVVASYLVERIRTLRSKRTALLSADPNRSQLAPDAFKLLLAEINREEEALMQSFTGKPLKAEWKARFRWTPKRGDPGGGTRRYCLFEFSAKEGVRLGSADFCPNDFELSSPANGIPVGFVVDSISESSGAKLVTVEVVTLDDSLAGRVSGGNLPEEDDRKTGFFYRIPGQALVEVSSTSKSQSGYQLDSGRASSLEMAEVEVPQLGVTTFLPRKAGWSKGASYQLELHPFSGGIKSVGVGSAAHTAAPVSALAGAVTTIQDARIADREKEIARLEAAAEEADELNRLKREKELLELRKAIEELENPVPDAGVEVDGGR